MRNPEYYSPRQAALAWGVSHEAVRQWIHAGHIPGVKRMGTRWKVPAATVERIAREGLNLGEK